MLSAERNCEKFHLTRNKQNEALWGYYSAKTNIYNMFAHTHSAKKNGKFWLVIDMRYLNSHLVVPKFKMEGLDTLAKMVEPEDHMFTVDLQDGYYHINMHESAIPYMGFHWEGQYYAY